MNSRRLFVNSAWNLVAALVLVPVLSGCIETVDSDKVSDESIYQTYRVTYLEESRQLSSTASFNVGGPWGTSVRLRSPSRVLMNDLPLSENTFLGTTYEGSWSVPFSFGPHRWTWIDQDGDSHVNSISIIPFRVENQPRSLSLGGALTLTLSGQPLTDEDSLGVWVLQRNSTGSLLYESLQTEIVNGGSVRIHFQNGTELSEGSATLYVQRTRSTGLQEEPARSGTLSASYRSAPIQVQITR